MSYTVIEDDKVLQIRASIGTRAELELLIEKLNRRLQSDFFTQKDDPNERRNARPALAGAPGERNYNASYGDNEGAGG